MTFVPLKLPAGVVRQATPYDQPNTFWDTSNVRWLSGAIMPIGGNTRITSEPLPAKVRNLFQWRDSSAREWTAVGHEDGVAVIFGSLADVTPTSFTSMNAIAGGGYGTLKWGTDVAPISDVAGTTVASSATVTITIASPGVITWTAHGLDADSVVNFTTTGALPTGITSGTDYYVLPLTVDTFKICLASGGKNGTQINTSGTQSGVHTGKWMVGQDNFGRQRSTNPPIFRKPDHWSFASFGEDLLGVCSSDGRLLHLSPTTGVIPKMNVPSNAPTNNTAMAVTAERAVVLIGAGGNARRVAWSDLEDYNGWTFNVTTGQAGYIDVESSSPLIAGVRVKEGTLLMSSHECFLLRYVAAPFFYGIEKLGSTTFSSPGAIASGGPYTVWFGEEGFWVYSGGSIRLLECPMWNDIKQNYDPLYGNYRSHMHENGAFPEFWFDYPSINSADNEPDQYVIWNYSENIWIKGQRTVTAAIGAVTANYPIGAKTDNNVYQFEDGYLDDGASRVGDVWAETAVLDFGQGDGYVEVNQALVSSDPNSDGTNYQIKFYSRYAPTQTEYTFGPYSPRVDGYTDTRVSGRDLRLRIEATNDNYWSLGQMRFDVNKNGGAR